MVARRGARGRAVGWPAVSLAVLALTFAACSASGVPRPSGAPPCRPHGLIAEGGRIPQSCSFRSFDGSTFTLASLAGRPAVLNFWASWCTFCVQEMPAFERVHKALGETVAFVGVDMLGVQGEVASAARSFARDAGVTYRLIFDDGGVLYSNFALRPVLPTTLLVSPDGRVVLRQFGPLDEASLRREIRRTLGVG